MVPTEGIEAVPAEVAPPEELGRPTKRRGRWADAIESAATGFLAGYKPELLRTVLDARGRRWKQEAMAAKAARGGESPEAALRNYIGHADPTDANAQAAAAEYQRRFGTMITVGFMQREDKDPATRQWEAKLRADAYHGEDAAPEVKEAQAGWFEKEGLPMPPAPEEKGPPSAEYTRHRDRADRAFERGQPELAADSMQWLADHGVPYVPELGGEQLTIENVIALYRTGSEVGRRLLTEVTGEDPGAYTPPRAAGDGGLSAASELSTLRQMYRQTRDPESRATLEEKMAGLMPHMDVGDFPEEYGPEMETILERLVPDPMLRRLILYNPRYFRQERDIMGNTTPVPVDDLSKILPAAVQDAKLTMIALEAQEKAPVGGEAAAAKLALLVSKYGEGETVPGSEKMTPHEMDLAGLSPEMKEWAIELGLAMNPTGERAMKFLRSRNPEWASPAPVGFPELPSPPGE